MQVKLWAVREEMADEQGQAAINNKSLSTVHRILQELATNLLSRLLYRSLPFTSVQRMALRLLI